MFSCLVLLTLGVVLLIVSSGGGAIIGAVLIGLSFVGSILLDYSRREDEKRQELENQILEAKIRKLEAKISLLEEEIMSEKMQHGRNV